MGSLKGWQIRTIRWLFPALCCVVHLELAECLGGCWCVEWPRLSMGLDLNVKFDWIIFNIYSHSSAHRTESIRWNPRPLRCSKVEMFKNLNNILGESNVHFFAYMYLLLVTLNWCIFCVFAFEMFLVTSCKLLFNTFGQIVPQSTKVFKKYCQKV